MRSFKNGHSADVKLGALLVTVILASAVGAAAQQRGGGSAADENMRMPNVSIEGERQTPDIFFVFPTGKGGNMSAPRFRDYGPDILDPVVKPWFERDEMVNPQPVQAASNRPFDWDEALKSSPPPAAPAPAAVAPQPPPSVREAQPNIALPPPSIPSQALSLPRTSAPPPPPQSSYPAPAPQPYYPPAPPASSRPSSSGSVPILVPPQ